MVNSLPSRLSVSAMCDKSGAVCAEVEDCSGPCKRRRLYGLSASSELVSNVGPLNMGSRLVLQPQLYR